MKLRQTNIWTEVTEGTDAERRWLDSFLTYESWGHGGVMRTYHLMDRFRRKFPSGLVARVVKRAAKDGQEVTVEDAREATCEPDDGADLAWLRDYQREAVEALVGRTRGLLWCPTGSGKTEIAIGITQRLPCRWLFLAHRGNLIEDAAARYNLRTGATAGVIRGDRWEWGDGGLVCATFQTIYSGLKAKDDRVLALVAGAQGLLVDEAHTVPAASFSAVVRACSGAYWRVGLSGTPLARNDARSVLAVANLGGVIYRIETERLINEGRLSRPEIVIRTCAQTSAKKTYASVYRDLVVRSKARNELLADMVCEAPKPSMVFVTQVAHGRHLQEVLRAQGMSAEYVDGKASIEHRRQAVKRLERGDNDVLICTTIFNEGVDIPTLSSVVLAAGGSSAIQTLQRIGRGMRVAQGKDTFRVYDVRDTGQRWLERHTRARIRAYRSEGHEVD